MCKRYEIDNSAREYHGALLDSEILSDVYIAMLGGHQTVLVGMETQWGNKAAGAGRQAGASAAVSAGGLIPQGAMMPEGRAPLLVEASAMEQQAHEAILARLGDDCIWQAEMQA